MAYDDNAKSYSGTVSSGNVTIGNYPQMTTAIRAEPQSPAALARLGKASQDYAEAASRFIEARDAMTDARVAWHECRDAVAKLAEAEGIA